MQAYLKQLFSKPTAERLAQTELEEAKRNLLRQQSASEYHAKLAEFYSKQVVRLTAYVNQSR